MIFNEFSTRKCDDKQRCHGCDYYVCVSIHIGFMPFKRTIRLNPFSTPRLLKEKSD